ncbi:MAG: hypothetical protein ACT4QG_03640 [Sporichthyaceae bacterium]
MSGTRQALSLLHGSLAVLQARVGTDDPEIEAAFVALQKAADGFDAVVLAKHGDDSASDSVEFEDDEDDDADQSEAPAGGYGQRVSVISRWDFTVLDRKKLIAEAERTMGEEIGEAGTSVTILAHLGARNGLAAGGNAKDAGLFWHGTITMAMPCDIAELGNAWVNDEPFANVDPDDSYCFITDALDETAIPGLHTFD